MLPSPSTEQKLKDDQDLVGEKEDDKQNKDRPTSDVCSREEVNDEMEESGKGKKNETHESDGTGMFSWLRFSYLN